MEESVHAGGWIGKPRGGKEKSSMNPRFDSSRFVAALAALIFVATACGSTGSGTPSASKGTLTVAGFNFPESSILAEIYGQALAHDGYTINYKLLLGNREVVAPALESGQIDLYPGYAATDLEYYNKSAGEANGDATATTATQKKYNLSKLSDLAPIGGQLTLGAGPECPTRPFCQPGLKTTYGITFKAFKPLDTDGPLTRAALENADNGVPILRQAAASAEVTNVLNAIDAKLTTADLLTMNSQVSLQHQDADAVATAWLQQHNYSS